jgi:Mrp family chromosome partitioning ATPase
MKTASVFIGDLERNNEHGLAFRGSFRYPYLHVAVHLPAFDRLEDIDEREIELCRLLDWDIAELRDTMNQANFRLHLLTKEEYEQFDQSSKERGHGWLRGVLPKAQGFELPREDFAAPPVRVIHFHGYKGGQARSSCLAFLARVLADDGWKILVVDTDVEAPSLDILFDTKPVRRDSTLLGVSQGAEPSPERTYVSPLGQGHVDLLAYRPASKEYDIEAVALATRASMDPLVIDQSATRIAEYAHKAGYHLLLIDHRAGLSPYNLPWLHRLPGSVVIFARLDEQWRAASSYMPVLLRAYPSMPGVFVSFKADGERLDQYLDRNQEQIEHLLEILVSAKLDALATVKGGTPGEDAGEDDEAGGLTALDLRDHFIVWPYDTAFRSVRIPDPERTSGELRGAIRELRRLLRLEHARETVSTPRAPKKLSPSGAQDEGAFIQTRALQQIQSANSSIRYIFGRKGTGKTRLLREMASQGLGEPLLVDPQAGEDLGLRATSPTMSKTIRAWRDDPEGLWWLLLGCGLALQDTVSEDLEQCIENQLPPDWGRNFAIASHFGATVVPPASLPRSPTTADLIDNVLARAAQQPKRRVFLLDGLEAAFGPNQLFSFIDALFRVLSTVQTDPRLSERLDFRLFLRADLAEMGIQNLEQQIHGQVAHLRWDVQSIFNFVLSRMQAHGWYGEHFPDAIAKIDKRELEILNGALDIESCEEILLEVFPSQISRHKLQTTTFLRTYFTDSASATGPVNGERATYYPRVYDRFIEVIAQAGTSDEYRRRYLEEQLDENGRIHPSLLIFAHEEAARDYLDQIRQELQYLIQLDPDFETNRHQIESLLEAFAGQSSPFRPNILARALTEQTGFAPESVRTAMNTMKALGMFENPPKYPDVWRVGRLFKTALRMKYVPFASRR